MEGTIRLKKGLSEQRGLEWSTSFTFENFLYAVWNETFTELVPLSQWRITGNSVWYKPHPFCKTTGSLSSREDRNTRSLRTLFHLIWATALGCCQCHPHLADEDPSTGRGGPEGLALQGQSPKLFPFPLHHLTSPARNLQTRLGFGQTVDPYPCLWVFAFKMQGVLKMTK